MSSASYSSIFGGSHEEAKLAIVAFSKWALNGLSIVVEFNLEFADPKGCWADIRDQQC